MKCGLTMCPYNIPSLGECGDSKTDFINECPCPENKIAAQKSLEPAHHSAQQLKPKTRWNRIVEFIVSRIRH